jgi:cytochrome c oxidase subunit I+III
MNTGADPGSALARDRARLAETWRDPAGMLGWISAVDHKSIGRRFVVTAFGFFALGGLLAALMRLQLTRPDSAVLSVDLYNQIFTMHGTTMMFLFATPIMLGVAIYIVPLMIGARAIALPRLVAFGYWMFLFGGVFLYVMFLLDVGPDNGWFNYVPLSGPEFGIGKRADVWAQFITFSEVSSLVVAVALATTILKMRTPGMALNRIPIYVWSILVVALMVIFAMPAIMLASTFLILDRLVSTHFFNQAEGGDPLLWQHLFWFFGHPEVYIFFLPAQGMMSTLIATFSRRPLFGYLGVVLSLAATAFIGFGVWVHHMFSTGLPQLGASFFTAASIMIVVPTGFQIFCWLATLWTGRLTIRTPMLYVLGFFGVFLIGGLTGVMLAAVPLNQQVHDTFFVVAHLHYVLIGGAVFPLLGAIHYWFPKMTGRLLSETLGRIAFWIFFVGFNLTFFPMHQLGLAGMPRRVYTYPAGMGWEIYNLLATIGAGLMFVALAVYLVNVIRSLRSGAAAADDPWEAPTLEWATASPPPPYNFEPQPAVAAREPLWDEDRAPLVVGLQSDKRQALVTRVLDAEPDHRADSPEPTPWPCYTAIATSAMFIWSIFSPWGFVIGSLPIAIALVGWFWPRHGKPPAAFEDDLAHGRITPLEQTS